MKFILGKKLGMTQVFRADGTVVPVTQIEAGPCVITQVKTKAKDGVDSIQVGFGEQKKFRLNSARQGHLKDLTTVRVMREARVGEKEAEALKRGDVFSVKIFSPGERVQVVGTSNGKGFQGVV
ncbi:MAG: 50S ribosomal protein L3, partial [Patescibacteria group bacterium]